MNARSLSGISKYHLMDTVFIWFTSNISRAFWGKSQGKKRETMPHRSFVVGGIMMTPGAVSLHPLPPSWQTHILWAVPSY